jgi:hypothetical protein
VAFDLLKLEMDRVVTYDGVDYRVVDGLASGLLLVAKVEDVITGSYPLNEQLEEKDVVSTIKYFN